MGIVLRGALARPFPWGRHGSQLCFTFIIVLRTRIDAFMVGERNTNVGTR